MLLRSILIIFLLPLGGLANPDTGRQASVPYSLSKEGLKRIEDNIRIVSGNLTNANRNLDASQSNIKTLEEELTDLDNFEQEVAELQKKLNQYRKNALEQNEKNEAALKRLENWMATLKAQSKASSNYVPSLEKAQTEDTNRKLWKQDTKTKLRRLDSLDQQARQNLVKIRIRRKVTLEEKAQWEQTTKKYEELVTELNKKKDTYEKIASAQKKRLSERTKKQ